MREDSLYRIIDEPRGSRWRAWVVNPFWPFLGLMLGGVWLGGPWFIFNSLAIGSATRVKEIALAVLMPVAVLALFWLMVLAMVALELPKSAGPYVMLAAVLAKLVLGYVLIMTQSRAFQLHRHFGGGQRNGALVAVAGFALRSVVLQRAAALHWLVQLVLQ